MISKKLAWLVILAIFFLSAFSSYSFFSGKGEEILLSPLSIYKPPKSNGNGNGGTVTNEPKTEECPLNGEYFSKTQKAKWEGRRPLGVMIENHTLSRPQSGLSSADIVYEAVAEGGITRFLSIFYCQDASYIGPVRSARIYFIKLLEGYGDNPLYAHVGGANTSGPADALGYISDLEWSSYNDLNQFSVTFPNYWRDCDRLPGISCGGGINEHTVYSSSAKLWQYAKDKRGLTNVDDKGKSWDKNYSSWKFQDDAKLENRGEATKIDFGFWDMNVSDYSVVWTYDKNNNLYLRENGGAPHLDKNSGKQLSAKNVLIMFAKESPANDGYEGGHLLYKVVGSGEALIFQNGHAIKGTWQRDDETTQVKFYDNAGKEIEIVKGKVWIEVLPVGNKVNY
ncbi:hypothetical protein COW98_05215 [Candidatus Roizmanbacteria bacterium CG22_combo_CG10-13_8_21_14_all_35_9]|uniref:DUF3048 domain-containing protein n=4 Tax=Candidatus Roizmaniibacteriota TaxID=1752723 RepID=A0A2M8F1J0_9BACT|nr:MAG: hypothetical protein COX47_03305 [Candidatus Roizmanbacteria bacterium CG23_combo_of_CG06-09_8_20_14_all_35_49]PIP62223.1 MAG: hypothetical protein COW98_05215 [Candidatus Roizmanbacteria bacterium CG22_combo_CG10-13_8_21_14_all_35_9]PIY71293.1 MAG: hypothetical protein COY88_01120 [Candidatus Roizmanbacteria bacterium CG_4_10_14_0_8_um_filter_35_28]PJC33159.1 MAG: hypothetical protein CO048_03685 [Candidatus Roizmanbacteria bacterium CG_4_9_14_0_2_um_filter_35_15]